MSYSLGVDLGTTFVAAAIATPHIEMVTLGDRSVVTPAVVYLGPDGGVVTGEAASRRAVTSPDRVGREFKRRLGDPTPLVLGGSGYLPADLLGMLLRDVVRKVRETEGAPPSHVVLTHPANWGSFRRELFQTVPRFAGLDHVLTITEPEAAAAHYANSRQLDDGDIVAVYDLGGGTFDVTLLRKLPGGVQILGTPEGIDRLGGIDFDERILAHVDQTSRDALSDLDTQDPRVAVALARLRQDCVLAKEALSVDTETVLPVFLPGRQFDVRMTRAEFEDMVRAPIESTIGAVFRALSSARVSPSELRAVLLVGGSSRIPLVARMVSDAIGRPTVVDSHPKYAVALGAATVAGLAAGRQSRQSTGLGADPGVTERIWTSNNSEVLALASVSARSTPGESVQAGSGPGRVDPMSNGSPTGPARTATMTLEVPAAVQTQPFEPPPPGRVSPGGPIPNGGAGPDRSQGTAGQARWVRRPDTARRLLAAGMLLLAVLIAVVVGYLIQSPNEPTSGTTSAGQPAPAARSMAIGRVPTGVDAYLTDITSPTLSVLRIGGP